MARIHSTPTRAAIRSALARYRQHLYAELNLQPSTIENYLGVVQRAAPVIGIRPTAIAARNYLATLAQAGNGYAHLTVTAVGLERYLDCLGTPGPLPRPRKPKTKPMEPLTEFEIALMIRAQRRLRDRAILHVLAYGGLRNSELCALRVCDVDIETQTITIRKGKGAKYRSVNIAGACVHILADYIRSMDAKPEDLLFTTVRNHLALEPQDLRKFVRAAADRADLGRRIHPHLFRHSLACHLIDHGADVFTVQQQLGHEHLATTMLYLHPSAERAATQYHAFAPQYSVPDRNSEPASQKPQVVQFKNPHRAA